MQENTKLNLKIVYSIMDPLPLFWKTIPYLPPWIFHPCVFTDGLNCDENNGTNHEGHGRNNLILFSFFIKVSLFLYISPFANLLMSFCLSVCFPSTLKLSFFLSKEVLS